MLGCKVMSSSQGLFAPLQAPPGVQKGIEPEQVFGFVRNPNLRVLLEQQVFGFVQVASGQCWNVHHLLYYVPCHQPGPSTFFTTDMISMTCAYAVVKW